MNKNTFKKQSLNMVKTASIIALLSASSTLMASGSHADEHDSDHGAKKMESEGHHGSKKEGNDHHGSMMQSGGHHGAMMDGDGDHDMSKMNMGSAPAHWMSPKAEAMKKNPVASSSKSVAKGAQLYRANCAVCHGDKAEGDGMAGMMLNPKPANLRVMSGGHPDGDFAFKIREGRGSMPGWKNSLSEKEIWHLVNFIQALNEEDEDEKEEKGHHAGGHS